jgi:hypothetical protein
MRVAAILRDAWKTAASLSLLAALAIGCGAVTNPALENARVAYQKARQDPVIVSRAGAALDRAAQTLEKADQLWAKDKDVTEVEHLAYIVEKRVEIARATAQRRLAEDELQQSRSPRP